MRIMSTPVANDVDSMLLVMFMLMAVLLMTMTNAVIAITMRMTMLTSTPIRDHHVEEGDQTLLW